MRTLQFKTDIDCPYKIEKAFCALKCLHGRYCHLSLDLTSPKRMLTLKSAEIQSNEVIVLLKKEGIRCLPISLSR